MFLVCQSKFVNPALPHGGVLGQPFAVALSVSLFPAVDYSDWAMCYAVDNATGATPPYCIKFGIKGSNVEFRPVSAAPAPSFDGLDAMEPHAVLAWFESLSVAGKRWGAASCPFSVRAAVPRHDGGAPKFLADDEGWAETYEDVWMVDGALSVTKHAGHEQHKEARTVSGALLAPINEPRRVAAAVRHLLKRLPVVRPLHLFHAPGLFAPCGAGAAVAADAAGGGTAAGGAAEEGDEGDEGDEGARAFLCRHVAAEAVLSHPLTVDGLSAGQVEALLKSRVLWARLKGADKALLVFLDDTDADGGGGGGSGGEQAHSEAIDDTWETTPRLWRDFAQRNFDFVPRVGCGGRAGLGFSLRDVELSLGCAEQYGHLVAGEAEQSFAQRCVAARGGRHANATELSRFREAVC